MWFFGRIGIGGSVIKQAEKNFQCMTSAIGTLHVHAVDYVTVHADISQRTCWLCVKRPYEKTFHVREPSTHFDSTVFQICTDFTGKY